MPGNELDWEEGDGGAPTPRTGNAPSDDRVTLASTNCCSFTTFSFSLSNDRLLTIVEQFGNFLRSRQDFSS